MKKFLVAWLCAMSIGVHASETLKLVIANAPGGPADAIARKIQKNTTTKDLTVVVANRPGADGMIGLAEFLNDNSRHALFLTTMSHVVKSAESEQNSQNIKKLVPVIHVANFGAVIFSTKNSNIKNWNSLVSESKSRPLTVGVGSVMHRELAEEIFKGNPNVTIVPYMGGDSPTLLGVLNNSVEVAVLTPSGYLTNSSQYGFNGIAVSGDRALNNLPPLTEYGFKKIAGTLFLGFAARPGTSLDDIKFYNELIQKSLQDPELRDWYLSQGIPMPQNTSVDAFKNMVSTEIKRIHK
jgi:tripartite-type tricarboxylate transporter receptor subunit TctC